MPRDLKPLVAELFGTFVLVFVGAGAVALHAGNILVGAFAHGFAVTGAAYMVGGASGAHINPAVTFGLATAGKIGWRKAGRYWAAQIAGGLLAALALRIALADRGGNLGATLLAEDVSVFQGLLIEAVLTAIVAFAVTVSGALGRNGNMGGVAVGLTLTACILMGGSLTGASFNPARTLGPGIVSGELSDLWVYLVGPCAGAAGGALFARYLCADRLG